MFPGLARASPLADDRLLDIAPNLVGESLT